MEKDKKFCILSVEIRDVLDDLLEDFDFTPVNVSLEELVVVVGLKPMAGMHKLMYREFVPAGKTLTFVLSPL
jgi:hypothetical protein